MAGVSIDASKFQIKIDDLIGDKALSKKAIESYELMEQRFNVVTRQRLSKTKRKGAGSLAQAWKGVIFSPAKNGTVTFGVTNPLPYARIHDKGDDIFPREKKFLAIPLTDEAKDQGWARDWQGKELRFGVSKAGNMLLFVPDPKKPKKAKRKRNPRKPRKERTRKTIGPIRPPVYGKPQYALKTMVTIPPTKYLDQAMKESFDLITQEVWG